jgi:hypothetical protein
MTDRLKRCFDAGSVTELFPLLRDWPLSELEQLISDVEQFQEESLRNLEEGWRDETFKPCNLFSRERSKALDDGLESASEHVRMTCIEIISVALYYKEAREKAQPKEDHV